MEESADTTTTTEALPTDVPDLVSLLENRKQIIEVCQSLRKLIDPSDDHYVMQKSLASEGIIPILVDLLATLQEAEQITEVCETISALCANIEGVSTRKRSGLESGFQELAFNPVQNELAEYDGLRKLVDLLDSELANVSEIALQTLSMCCSFNHSNKVSYLRCLVHDMLESKIQRLQYINTLISDMEVRDDVTVLLDQLILPTLRLIQNMNDTDVKREALILMGKMCERHSATSTFLCEEGALPPVVQIILNDDVLHGKAVHVLWQMIRLNKKQLDPSKDKLKSEGVLLVKPLLSIIKSSNIASDTQGDTDAEDLEEDYSDEALLVLKALAEQDESVREEVGDLIEPETSGCSLM